MKYINNSAKVLLKNPHTGDIKSSKEWAKAFAENLWDPKDMEELVPVQPFAGVAVPAGFAGFAANIECPVTNHGCYWKHTADEAFQDKGFEIEVYKCRNRWFDMNSPLSVAWSYTAVVGALIGLIFAWCVSC